MTASASFHATTLVRIEVRSDRVHFRPQMFGVKIERLRHLTPRLVSRILLPVSYSVFFLGTLASAAIFYQGKPFDPRAAMLSSLQSPHANPHGYGGSAFGLAGCAILWFPATAVFYVQLRPRNSKLALTGAVMLAMGLTSAVTVGVLAPFTSGNSVLHVRLASATFAGVCSGTFLHLLAARASRRLLAFQLLALLAVLFLCCGRIAFDNARLLTSMALWEWVLSFYCAGVLWILAKRVEEARQVE